MTLDDMIGNGITIEGCIEIRRWDNENEPTILFKGDEWELDYDAGYVFEDIKYMFAYKNGYDSILCVELCTDQQYD